MKEDQLISILLTKEELYRLWSMCHDSSMYWYNHWRKSTDDIDYHLSETGCKLMLEQIQKILAKVEAVYVSTKEQELKDAA